MDGKSYTGCPVHMTLLVCATGAFLIEKYIMAFHAALLTADFIPAAAKEVALPKGSVGITRG